MLKVLIVSHTYVVGVNQQKITALAKIKDVSVGLVVPTKWKSSYGEVALDKTTDSTYEIFPVKVFASGRNDRFIYDPVTVLKIVRQFKPDIVQIEEEPWSLACLQLATIAKTVKAKVIFFTWENLARDFRPYYKLSLSNTFRLVSGAIAGNEEASEVLKKQGFRKPVAIIPQLGVDVSFFKRAPLPKEFTVGFIGRFDKQKGIMTLLESLLLSVVPPHTILVGNGPLLEEMQSFISQNFLESVVEIHTDVKHQDIPKILEKITCLVLPSLTTSVWKEQFGHVLIEAMAAGRAVVGSSSGAIPEVIGESGLIFTEGSAADLASALEKLQKDTKFLHTLIEDGYSRVQKEYTQEKIAQRTYQFYQNLLT